MFEPEVFREQMYCIEESSNIVETFRRPLQLFGAPGSDPSPLSDSAPGNYVPLVPLVTPLSLCSFFSELETAAESKRSNEGQKVLLENNEYRQ